jgi:hypothetical protein
LSSVRDRIIGTPILRALVGFILVFAVTGTSAWLINGKLWGALITSVGMAVYFYFRAPRQ